MGEHQKNKRSLDRANQRLKVLGKRIAAMQHAPILEEMKLQGIPSFTWSKVPDRHESDKQASKESCNEFWAHIWQHVT